MQFASALESILKAGVPAAARRFGSAINAQWVDEALELTGTMSVRRRRLPARLVVWLVISMALFRDCGIRTVAMHLGLSNPWGKARSGDRARSVAPSAVAKARQRLGDKAMQLIFERSAEAWAAPVADADRWRGLSLWGADGTTLNVPDTIENEEAFGLPGTDRGRSGYPQVRMVALMALRSHLLRGASFGPYRGKETGEQALVQDLQPLIPDHSLTIFDKGFLNYGALWRLHHDAHGTPTARHFLIRAKTNLKWKVLAVLGPGDELVEVSMSPQSRARDPGLPRKMRMRVVSYQVDGWPKRRLLTSLLDPERFPAVEVAAMYHERWETELGYAEFKTTMLERKEALRSRTPVGVRQEIWGALLAYNLVRLMALEAAEEAGIPPTRISFKNALHLIRTFCTVNAWTAPAGTLGTELRMLREMLAVLILPERRPNRRYKRHVKIKMSGYERNPGRASSTGGDHKGNDVK
jgi:hypothetical protein